MVRRGRRLITLLVFYVDADRLHVARVFYAAALGIEFVQEKHQEGPVHYAGTLADGAVIELYPATARRPATSVRLELTTEDPSAAAERLREAGFEVRERSTVVLAVDPSGNTVALRH